MEKTIAISEHLANRLEGYLQQNPHESLSSLLEEILQHKENKSQAKTRFLRIQPAPKGSGYANTSIDHDKLSANIIHQ